MILLLFGGTRTLRPDSTVTAFHQQRGSTFEQRESDLEMFQIRVYSQLHTGLERAETHRVTEC